MFITNDEHIMLQNPLILMPHPVSLWGKKGWARPNTFRFVISMPELVRKYSTFRMPRKLHLSQNFSKKN